MTWHYHESTRIVLVIVLALIARLAFVGIWQHTHVPDPREFEFPDSVGYWELGKRLAAGESYQVGSTDRRVFRTPGYPLLLAAMFRVVGQDASPTSARVMGAMLGALTVGAVYWLARLTFGTRVAWLAAAIVAVCPESIAISVVPLSDGPFCLWMVLQLAAWRRGTYTDSSSGMWVALAAGVLAGVATLTRPSWLLFTPVLVAAWTVATKFERRQMLIGAAMLLGLAATMTPWWLYASRIAGQFVATTLWVGPSLYDGLSPEADGRSDMRFVAPFEEGLRTADAVSPPKPGSPPFEVRFDRMLRDKSLQWVSAHPTRVLQLAGIKLGRMWNFWPNESQFRSLWVRSVVFASYAPLILMATYGAWRFREERGNVLLLLLPALYLSGLHAVFIGSLRYRQPAMLTLAILAAAGLIEIFDRWRSIQKTRPAAKN